MTPQDRIIVEHLARHVHALGPRAIAEVLVAICDAHLTTRTMLRILQPYQRLTPEMMRAAGADRPVKTMQVVP